MKKQIIIFAATIFLGVTSGALQAQPSVKSKQPGCTPSTCAYLNPSLAPGQRAKDLVHRMTLEEKVSQMRDAAPGIPRLGVPAYNWWNEALHGVARNGFATNFPESIGLAATFDTSLMHQVARVISVEGRAKYNEAIRAGDRSRFAGLTFWSPNVNIFRDPRWGRGMETYGEDPFLTASMGVQFVKGLQGDNSKYFELVATPKHFAVHSGPEPLRHGFNVNPSAHDLEDTYLPAFRATIMDGRADSTMCSYNAVDGKPACANSTLMQQYLRSDWKFDGFAVSDCDAIADIARGHHFAANMDEAAADGVKAGTDLDCGAAYDNLVNAVHDHLLSDADIDKSVVALFTARMRLGMFDPAADVPFNAIPYSEVDSAAHRQVALQAARESIVLLKNHNDILPLKSSIRKIAVIGPDADLIESIEGNYNGTARNPVTPLEGMRKQFGSAKILYEPGAVLAAGTPIPIPSAYLRTDATMKTPGLKGEYFGNLTFAGAPKMVRTDAKINFDWNRVAPSVNFPSKAFAVRWTGELLPPAAGEYSLNFRGPRPPLPPGSMAGVPQTTQSPQDRIRLYIDGKLIIDSRTNPPIGHVTFADTHPHSIRVEYVHELNDRNIGLEWEPPAGSLLAPAIEAAKKADAVVAFVGLSPNLEGEEMNVHAEGFDGGDRTRIELPDSQQHLLEALGATGKPLVIVLTAGSALAVPWAKEHADAILDEWYPGEEGGDAIAETLAGTNNPAGRLPVTFYRSTSDLPPFTDYSMIHRTYRYYKGEVLYPFGYGLSYSTFTYGSPDLSSKQIHAGSPVTVTATVRNASKRNADEVAELYIVPPQTAVSPHVELEGFTRVHLPAGAAHRVQFTLTPRELSEVDANGNRVVVSGDYKIYISGEQPGAGAPAATLHVEGSMGLPK